MSHPPRRLRTFRVNPIFVVRFACRERGTDDDRAYGRVCRVRSVRNKRTPSIRSEITTIPRAREIETIVYVFLACHDDFSPEVPHDAIHLDTMVAAGRDPRTDGIFIIIIILNTRNIKDGGNCTRVVNIIVR